MLGTADLHVHTRYSGLTRLYFLRFPDSISYPSEIVKMAERRQINVLCVTDHNSIRGALEAMKTATSVEIVAGSEIATLAGDLLGIFLSEDIPRCLPADETIDKIHEQGGLAIAPHPFSSHCDSLGMKIMELKLDGVELLNAAHRDGYTNDAAQTITKNMRVAFVGGSDAHAATMVGNAYTKFKGDSAEDLRKAILRRETGFAGESTPLKDLIWMTVNVTVELCRTLSHSLVSKNPIDDTECARVISQMRSVSKVVSLMGATAFLVPPTPAIVGVLGDRIGRSRSRVHFTRVTNNVRKDP
jgi:hypothetical protein